jgi:hypothetical protein
VRLRLGHHERGSSGSVAGDPGGSGLTGESSVLLCGSDPRG